MTIGFIGLGIMGESMCSRIVSVGGHKPVVYDAQPGLIDKLVALGAERVMIVSGEDRTGAGTPAGGNDHRGRGPRQPSNQNPVAHASRLSAPRTVFFQLFSTYANAARTSRGVRSSRTW